jgi:hypothetical protein
VFARSAWDQPSNVVAGTTYEGAAPASVPRSAWAQQATVLAGATGEGVALASFACSASSQPATVVVCTLEEGDVLPSVHWVVVGSANHFGGWLSPGECAVLDPVRSVGIGSTSHCSGGHDM